MKQVKFLKCSHCGNIVLMLEDKGVPISCCGTPMHLLKANSADAANEKHVPVVLEKTKTSTGVPIAKVQVGSVIHPMLPEHSINWIGSFSNKAWVIKWLNPGEQPNTELRLDNDAQIYEYCNLHGLWKK